MLCPRSPLLNLWSQALRLPISTGNGLFLSILLSAPFTSTHDSTQQRSSYARRIAPEALRHWGQWHSVNPADRGQNWRAAASVCLPPTLLVNQVLEAPGPSNVKVILGPSQCRHAHIQMGSPHIPDREGWRTGHKTVLGFSSSTENMKRENNSGFWFLLWSKSHSFLDVIPLMMWSPQTRCRLCSHHVVAIT